MLETVAAGPDPDVFGIAIAYLRLGDRDRALEWLTKGFDAKELLAPFMRLDPALDSLRADPRFQKLVTRLAIPERASAHAPLLE